MLHIVHLTVPLQYHCTSRERYLQRYAATRCLLHSHGHLQRYTATCVLLHINAYAMHGDCLVAKYAAHRASDGTFAVPAALQEVPLAVRLYVLFVVLNRAPAEGSCVPLCVWFMHFSVTVGHRLRATCVSCVSCGVSWFREARYECPSTCSDHAHRTTFINARAHTHTHTHTRRIRRNTQHSTLINKHTRTHTHTHTHTYTHTPTPLTHSTDSSVTPAGHPHPHCLRHPPPLPERKHHKARIGRRCRYHPPSGCL